jgi:GLPGLI family protein
MEIKQWGGNLPFNKRMKKTLLIFCLILFVSAYSQENGGEVNYRIEIAVDTTLKSKSSRLEIMQEKALNGSKKIKLKLEFDSKNSKFYLEKGLEDSDTQFAVAWANCKNTIYTISSDNKSYYNNSSNSMEIVKENEFLIYNELGSEWITHNEYKMIDTFICYKATKSVEYETRNGLQKKLITAWYCPELPYSFGPNGYFGLPGLILELTDKNVTFIAQKINLLKKEKIEFVKKGKLISNKEYQNILKNRIEEVKENLKN